MSKSYQTKISRREGLKRIASLTSFVLIGGVTVACDTPAPEPTPVAANSHWPDLNLQAITASGYGTDPVLTEPAAPWPRTLSRGQLNLVAVLSDIICPADAGGPAATDVGVPDVIDEWVSAPYASQQRDRVLISNGLQWLDDEAERRFQRLFAQADNQQQLAIITDIAFSEKQDDAEFEHAVGFFSRLRSLVLGAYFTSPEGIEDIGYIGNTPISGDYPGPTDEAMQHLQQIIAEL